MMTDRSYGVEIEAVGPSQGEVVSALRAAGVACNLDSYGSRTASHWKVQTDGSVQITHLNQGSGTFEVVSPILRGEEGVAEVKKVCAALATVNAKVNKTCGLHVHFGIRDLTHEQIKKVCKRWVRDEKYIDLVMPASRRGNNNEYCRSNAPSPDDVPNRWSSRRRPTTVEEMFEAISRTRTFSQLQDLLCPSVSRGARFHKMNLLAFVEHGTIEFRQHSGTVDGDKISYWVEFLDSLIAEALALRTVRNWTRAQEILPPEKQVHRLVREAHTTVECLRYYEGRAREFAALNVNALHPTVPLTTSSVAARPARRSNRTNMVTPAIANYDAPFAGE